MLSVAKVLKFSEKTKLNVTKIAIFVTFSFIFSRFVR